METKMLSRCWLATNMKDRIDKSLLDKPRKRSFQKTSRMSTKRMAAGNPMRSYIMTAKFLAVYQHHFDNGILSTPKPLASQVWNCDEKGVMPNGKWKPSYTLGRSGARGFTSATGERSPFWVTILFATRADGAKPPPPMVVHQGGDDKNLPAIFTSGLPDDWLIHSTKSGYLDEYGFSQGILCSLCTTLWRITIQSAVPLFGRTFFSLGFPSS